MLNKEALIISLKLFVITAVSALLLAAVNIITEPIIAVNSEKAQAEAQREVLPEADDFKEVEFSEKDIPVGSQNGVSIASASVGLSGGKAAGYVVTAVSSEGYGGDVKVMIGISSDLKVTKAKIIEASETPGLGGNASKPKFIDQFENMGGGLTVVKGGSADAQKGEVAAISGATITSNAVTSCVNAAVEFAAAKSTAEAGAESAARVSEKLEQTKKMTDEQIKEGGK